MRVLAAITWMFSLFLVAGCGGAGTTAKRNIPYDERFGDQTTLDVFSPATASGARPGVMVIHGGGWREGAKEQLEGFSRRLAAEGYVVATINYRLTPAGTYPAAVQDCRCALSYLTTHAAEFNLRPDAIALLGHSAGGHLASLLAVGRDIPETVSDCAAGTLGAPRGVVAAAAPQDLELLSWAPDVQKFMGGTLTDLPQRYAAASPLLSVAAGAPPFLLIHGTMDVYVSSEHAVRMQNALRQAGNAADLLLLRGGGHVLNPSVGGDQLLWEEYALDSPEAWWAVTDFLRRTIGANEP